jgi:hypothetical protein
MCSGVKTIADYYSTLGEKETDITGEHMEWTILLDMMQLHTVNFYRAYLTESDSVLPDRKVY